MVLKLPQKNLEKPNILRILSHINNKNKKMKKLIIVPLLMLLTSCAVEFGYITPGYVNEMNDAQYSDARESHTEVHYYNNNIYWGWNEGYWWYYYQFCPPHEYHAHTHVHINLGKGHIVKKPNHNRFNNKKGGKYTPNVKTRSNIKVNTRSNNKNKTNNIKVNTRSNVKVNTNRSNVKVKTRSNVKVKTRSNRPQ